MKTLSYFFGLIAIFIFGIAATSWADCNQCANQRQPRTISLESRPEFADVREELQAVVNVFGFQSVNQFYIVTYPPASGDNIAVSYVYWPTQNKLIAWGTGANRTIISADVYLDVRRDALPDGINTSTYLLTRSQMRAQISDCLKFGEHFTIKKP